MGSAEPDVDNLSDLHRVGVLMPLETREVEFVLNGGMDTKSSAELQEASTLRNVNNLRWNATGELEKRPTYDTTLSPSAFGLYNGTAVESVFARGKEPAVLLDDYGVGHVAGGALRYARSLEAATQAKYCPRAARVERQIIHSAQDNQSSGGIISVSSAIYNSTTLVVAWIENAGTSNVLMARAYDITTGAQIALPLRHTSSVGDYVRVCEYTESGNEGVIIAYRSTTALTISALRYRAATNDFAVLSNLSTNASSSDFGLVSNGANFYFAFKDNTTGFLKAQLRTLSTVSATHDATHAADHFAIVIGGSDTLVCSVTSTTSYAEKFGTPAGVATVHTASSETFSGIQVSLEGTSTAVMAVSADGVRYALINFSGAPAASDTGRIPSVITTGAAFTYGSRSYHAFSDATSNQVTGSLIVARFARHSTGTARWDAIARMCHDRFTFYQNAVASSGMVASLVGATAYIAAPGDRSILDTPELSDNAPQTIFLSKLTLGVPAQTVQLGDVLLGSSGLLWEYDGDSPGEAQPLAKPIVTLDVSTAGSKSGTFSVVAYYRWVDAAGRLHRSAPSDAVSTGAIANKRIDVTVTKPPFTAFDGVSALAMEPEVYVTTNGGSTYLISVDASVSTQKDSYDTTNAKGTAWVFQGVTTSASSTASVYSTGAANEELVSEPPPAMRSIAVVGDRVWGIDAEDPTRIWYSKPILAGFAVEWNTACTLFIGDVGVAMVDANGVPTVLGKSGIWQVYGEGPNALGVGSFAPARRLPHEVECVDSLGTCKTPVGVMFRGRRGIYLLGNDMALTPIGLPVDPEVVWSDDVAGSYVRMVYDEVANEVRVIDSQNGLFVYNLVEGKWSEWSQSTQIMTDAAVVAGRVWYANNRAAMRREYAISSSSRNSHTESWSLQTPKLKLDGLAGFSRLLKMWLQVRLGASVSNVTSLAVTLTVWGADGASTDNTYSWTGAELAALGSTGSVVQLPLQPTTQRAVAFRVTATETNSSAYVGSVPIALRVKYGVIKGSKNNKTGALKGAASVA